MLTNIQDLITAGTFPHNYISDDPKRTSRVVSVWRDDELEKFITWTDKASYLEWVVQWKATYKALTKQARGQETTIYRTWRARAYDHVRKQWAAEESEQRAPIYQTRWLAQMLLALRAYGKRKSWAMKQQVKQVA